MINRSVIFAAALTSCLISFVHADSVLVYETTLADGTKSRNTISISRLWLRLDTEAVGDAGATSGIEAMVGPAPNSSEESDTPSGTTDDDPSDTTSGTPSQTNDERDYALMDTGRLMKFDVDESEQSFSVTRVGRLYWPSAPATPLLEPTQRFQHVAGVRCRVVLEIAEGKRVAEHCMVPSGPLGLSAREMITLSRLFTAARRIRLGWTGVATPDERQVSIRSRSLTGSGAQELLAVSHGIVPDEQLRIPPNYKRLTPDRPVLPRPTQSALPSPQPPQAETLAPSQQPEPSPPPGQSGSSEQPASSDPPEQPVAGKVPAGQ